MPSYAAPLVELKRLPGDYLARRKRLRKAAERQYPGRVTAWYGGILYFTDRGIPPEAVPGVENVPKPGNGAVGFVGAQRTRSPKDSKPRLRGHSPLPTGARERMTVYRYDDGDSYCGHCDRVNHQIRLGHTDCRLCGGPLNVLAF